MKNIGVEKIKDHVNFIVHNTHLYKHSAPEITNLTIYVLETGFINKRMCAKKEQAWKHTNNFRLQVDVLTWGVLQMNMG